MFNSLFSKKTQARLAHGTTRHHRAVLLVAVLVTLLSLVCASRLRLESDIVALLPEDSESVTELRRLTDKLGGAGDIQVMIRSPKGQGSIEYARTLLPKIRALPWVDHASMGNPTEFFDERKLLYVDLEDLQTIEERVRERVKYETLAAQPLYIDLEDSSPPSLDFSEIEAKYRGKEARSPYFRNQSGSILLILVQPRGLASDLAYAQRVQREMHALIDRTNPANFHPDMTVEVGGAYRNRIDEYQAITSDVTASSAVVALAILVFIILYFRAARAAFVVMTPLLMSLCWTFGLAFLLIGSLNLVTVFLIVVLMGLGIDFGFHLLARYEIARSQGAPLEDALTQSFCTAGRSSTTAAVTTAVCFLGLIATDFRGFVEFSVIASTGLLMSALAYFSVMPALLATLATRTQVPTPASIPKATAPRTLQPAHARVVLVFGLAIIGAALFVGRGAEFEYDMRKLRAKMPQTREFNQRVREVFPKARDPAAVLVAESENVRRVAAALEARRLATSPNSPIDSVLSVYDFVPRNQDLKLAILAQLAEQVDGLLEILDEEEKAEFAAVRRDLNAKPVASIDELPAELLRKFKGRPGTPGQVIYVYQSGSLLDLRTAKSFSRVLPDLEVNGVRYMAISEPLIYVAMLRTLSRDTPRALVLAALGLLFVLLLDFRSLVSVGTVLVPILSGLALMVGCMALIPIRLNFVNAVVLPSMLGIGVDGGVHIYHGILERGTAAMGQTLRETGSAVAACTMTSLLGFAGMLIADHPGLRSIGLLALVGLLGCLFGALVILPALVASFPKIGSRA